MILKTGYLDPDMSGFTYEKTVVKFILTEVTENLFAVFKCSTQIYD